LQISCIFATPYATPYMGRNNQITSCWYCAAFMAMHLVSSSWTIVRRKTALSATHTSN